MPHPRGVCTKVVPVRPLPFSIICSATMIIITFNDIQYNYTHFVAYNQLLTYLFKKQYRRSSHFDLKIDISLFFLNHRTTKVIPLQPMMARRHHNVNLYHLPSWNINSFIPMLSICCLKATLSKVEKCLQNLSRPLPPSETSVTATQWETFSYEMMQ